MGTTSLIEAMPPFRQSDRINKPIISDTQIQFMISNQ